MRNMRPKKNAMVHSAPRLSENQRIALQKSNVSSLVFMRPYKDMTENNGREVRFSVGFPLCMESHKTEDQGSPTAASAKIDTPSSHI